MRSTATQPKSCTFLCLSPPPFSRGAQNWWFIMLVRDLVYSLSESDFRISFSERYHVSSNSAECLYHTNFKSPSNNHLSVLLEATAIWSGMLAVLYVLRILMWPWPDPRSRSLTSWSSENCTFLRLSPPLFWRGTHNWWVITRVWDQVYSFSEPHFWIFPHLTVTWRNLAIARIHCVFSPRWPMLEACDSDLHVDRVKPCTLAAMTISPLRGFFN